MGLIGGNPLAVDCRRIGVGFLWGTFLVFTYLANIALTYREAEVPIAQVSAKLQRGFSVNLIRAET